LRSEQILKVTHVGNYWNRGGAATAMVRVHEAIQSASNGEEVASRIQVALSERQYSEAEDSSTLATAPKSIGRRLDSRVRKTLGRRISVATGSVVSIPPSFPTGLGALLNKQPIDIVNLHWLGGATLSLRELRRLQKPVVWRLPDLWPAGSVEHYPSLALVESGYRHNELGLPADVFLALKWFWKQKARHLDFPFLAVCPSEWTREFAERSPLFRNVDCEVIPNPLDTDFWKPDPYDRLVLPQRRDEGSRLRLLFGAAGGTQDPRKGWAFFRVALERLAAESPGVSISIEVFGERRQDENLHGFPIKFLGPLDSVGLRNAYRRADLFVATPSQESFGQTVTEAQSCGTAVLGTKVGGLRDNIECGVSGYLVDPGDVRQLSNWLLHFAGSLRDARVLGINARQRAVRLWSYGVVGRQYIELYKEIVQTKRKTQR